MGDIGSRQTRFEVLPTPAVLERLDPRRDARPVLDDPRTVEPEVDVPRAEPARP